MVWTFNKQQERQAEAHASIIAENADDRRLERMTWSIKVAISFLIGCSLTFLTMVGIEAFFDITPTSVWDWMFGE